MTKRLSRSGQIYGVLLACLITFFTLAACAGDKSSNRF
jgi:hypothetical protein